MNKTGYEVQNITPSKTLIRLKEFPSKDVNAENWNSALWTIREKRKELLSLNEDRIMSWEPCSRWRRRKRPPRSYAIH